MTVEIGSLKIMESPVGKLAVSASDNGVRSVDFLEPNTMRIEFVNSETAALYCDGAITWLRDYFEGKNSEYAGAFDLEGTDFQRAVWREIRSIAFGEKLTYGDIAKRIGRPRASRAVGAAVGANPVPLLIPCHRVLGAAGRITGYSGGEGIPTKKVLLALEKIDFLP